LSNKRIFYSSFESLAARLRPKILLTCSIKDIICIHLRRIITLCTASSEDTWSLRLFSYNIALYFILSSAVGPNSTYTLTYTQQWEYTVQTFLICCFVHIRTHTLCVDVKLKGRDAESKFFSTMYNNIYIYIYIYLYRCILYTVYLYIIFHELNPRQTASLWCHLFVFSMSKPSSYEFFDDDRDLSITSDDISWHHDTASV